MGIARKFIEWVPHNMPGTLGKLKLDLYKFPTYIGHATSRINRLSNEDRYSIAMLKLMSSDREYQMNCNFNSKNKNLLNTQSQNTDLFTHPVLNINVFDGHGGQETSQWLSENISNRLASTVPNKETFFKILAEYCKEFPDSEYWNKIYLEKENFYERFIVNCSTKKEQVLYNGSRMIFDKNGNIIDKTSLLNELDRLRIFQTFLEIDLENCKNKLPGGSTSSSILLSPYNTEEVIPKEHRDTFFVNSEDLLKLCVVQLGDCKVLICDKDGKAHQLTIVHHPNTVQESARLKQTKQTDVTESVSTDSFGEQRFLNMYANTRSFGDLDAKSMGLTCEPDIYSYLIGNTKNLPHEEKSKLQFGGDECFICLVSDGVTGSMSDQEIVDLITSTVNNRGLKRATPQFVCDEVIKYLLAISGRSADNATCLVIRLNNWGNWPVYDRTGAMREEKLMNSDEPRE